MSTIITARISGERLSPEEIDRRLAAHALMTAADLHCRIGGTDEAFMDMARSALNRARE